MLRAQAQPAALPSLRAMSRLRGRTSRTFDGGLVNAMRE
jgi:hypothetical protein